LDLPKWERSWRFKGLFPQPIPSIERKRVSTTRRAIYDFQKKGEGTLQKAVPKEDATTERSEGKTTKLALEREKFDWERSPYPASEKELRQEKRT